MKAVIQQGKGFPAWDIDNYATKIVNALTYTKLLWLDDCQIDELHVVRSFDEGQANSAVELVIELLGAAQRR